MVTTCYSITESGDSISKECTGYRTHRGGFIQCGNFLEAFIVVLTVQKLGKKCESIMETCEFTLQVFQIAWSVFHRRCIVQYGLREGSCCAEKTDDRDRVRHRYRDCKVTVHRNCDRETRGGWEALADIYPAKLRRGERGGG